MGLRAVDLDLIVSRVAARRGVVRHVALDLAERPEHADEGEDLQLADHRDPGLKLPFYSSHPRPSRGTGTGRTCARPCLATSRHWLRVVAEESGDRDTAVLDLSRRGGGSRWSGRCRAPKTVTEQPGLRPSDEPFARSISSTRAGAVATDECETHRRRVVDEVSGG